MPFARKAERNIMSKILVIYQSKTGFTRKYAQWIAEETGCDLLPYEQRERADFSPYDMILYGGGFYAGTIAGIKWFKKKLPELSGKRTAVFATGSTPANTPEAEKAMKQNFTPQEWKQLKAFYLPGGLNYEKMGSADKFLMFMFRGMIKKKEGEDSERYRAISASYDNSSREFLKELLAWLKR